MPLTEAEIADAIKILQKVLPTDEECARLVDYAQRHADINEERELDALTDDALEEIYLHDDGPFLTREEDQLLRESDERAAFNDRLDMMRDQ